MDALRKKRIRLLVNGLKNRLSKQQKKIDILCNDMVETHTEFAAELQKLCFVLEFYESVIGLNNVGQVLENACRAYRTIMGDVSVAFYLSSKGGFEYHNKSKDDEVVISPTQIEGCFTQELADALSSENDIQTLADIKEIALNENLSLLDDLNLVVIPLRKFGPEIGFALIYCDCAKLLKVKMVELAGAMSTGLAKVIAGSLDSKQQDCSL